MKISASAKSSTRNATQKPAHIAVGQTYELQDVAAFIAADIQDRKARASALAARSNAHSVAGFMLSAIPTDARNCDVIASLNACPELLAHIAKRCKSQSMYQKKADKDGNPVIAAGRWFGNSGLKDALKTRGFSVGMTTAEGAPVFRMPDAGKAAGGKKKAANNAKGKAKAEAKAKPAQTAPAVSESAPLTAEQHATALACLPLPDAVRLFCRALQDVGHTSAHVLEMVADAAGWDVESETVEVVPVAQAA